MIKLSRETAKKLAERKDKSSVWKKTIQTDRHHLPEPLKNNQCANDMDITPNTQKYKIKASFIRITFKSKPRVPLHFNEPLDNTVQS